MPFSDNLPPTKLLRVPSGTIHYREGGRRKPGEPPVLLLHGLGSDLDNFNMIWPMLENEKHLFAYDHPGFGPLSHEVAPCRIEHLSQVASEVIEHHFGEPVDVVSSSMGGLVAIHLMRYYPHLVNRTILCCPAGAGREQARTAELTGFVAEKLSDSTPFQLAYLFFTYKQHMGHWFPPGMDAKEWSRRFFIRRAATPMGVQTKNFFLHARDILSTSGLEWAREIEHPCLIIVGTKDSLVSVASTERYKEAIKNSELVVIPDATHALITSYKDVIAPEVLRFLNYTTKVSANAG